MTPTKRRMALCHPDADHYALDLCLPCYHREYRQYMKSRNIKIESMMSKPQRLRARESKKEMQ